MKWLLGVVIDRCPYVWPLVTTFARCFAPRPETEADPI